MATNCDTVTCVCGCEPDGRCTPPQFHDALGDSCFGPANCQDASACGRDLVTGNCLYNNGHGCVDGCFQNPLVDNCGIYCGFCLSDCDHGICSCFDPDGCGCGNYANSDALGTTCDPANCFDSTACGRDVYGNCNYTDACGICAGGCSNLNCDYGICGCFDVSGCGCDSGGNNIIDQGCGCGNPGPTDNCHDCSGNCICLFDSCGTCGGQCDVCDHGICGCYDGDGCGCGNFANNDSLGSTCGPANCFDSAACGRDANGYCQYTNCDGSCTSSSSNPYCCPIESDVRNGITYYCAGSYHTGTLSARSASLNIGSLIGLPPFIPL